MTVPTPESDLLRDQMRNVLDYPIGADRITFVDAGDVPVHVETLRRRTFPLLSIFTPRLAEDARACAKDGARVRLTTEVARSLTEYITRIERV